MKMPTLRYATVITLSALTAFAPAKFVLAADGDWVAELRGPIQRCKVPQRILFIADDAIISGKITFRGKTYYPRGRLEDTLETKFSLVTRYGDPKPLVSITGKANGRWGGEWASGQTGCKGKVRMSPR